MAMPNNSLSQIAIKYTWRGRDTQDPTDLQDTEEGGVALNNTSMGLEYQLWTFTYDAHYAYVNAPNQPKIALFAKDGIENIRGCFDQNMNPFVAFFQGGQWQYWWYDTVSSGMVFSSLPVGVTSVACTLDDKRQINSNTSDILLFYTNNGNLYHRRQRDRYTAELLVRAGVGGTLVKVGMNGIQRLQIKMQTPPL